MDMHFATAPLNMQNSYQNTQTKKMMLAYTILRRWRERSRLLRKAPSCQAWGRGAFIAFCVLAGKGGAKMNPVEVTASVTALANALARTLSDEQLDLAAAVFTQLGDTLSTISVLRGICESNTSGTTDSNETTTDKSASAESSAMDTSNAE